MQQLIDAINLLNYIRLRLLEVPLRLPLPFLSFFAIWLAHNGWQVEKKRRHILAVATVMACAVYGPQEKLQMQRL